MIFEEQKYYDDNINMLSAKFGGKYLLISKYNLIASFETREQAKSFAELHYSPENYLVIYCEKNRIKTSATELSSSFIKEAFFNIFNWIFH